MPIKSKLPSKVELRDVVRKSLPRIITRLNEVLEGKALTPLNATMRRIGFGGQEPHWYSGLKKQGALPNADGKTIGSILEMLLVGVLETMLANQGIGKLRINPAKGIDLPDLDLGVKSPSTNFCTSEPFFSAYERLYGNDHDAIILLTDYQKKKASSPLRLQVIDYRYLKGSEIADEGLCAIALRHREALLKSDIGRAKRFLQFIAFVNQADWRARTLLKMAAVLDKEKAIISICTRAERDFVKQNLQRDKKNREPLAKSDLKAIQQIKDVRPVSLGVIDAAENWLAEMVKDAARLPNENEWQRLLASNLDGKLGLSFALQWRYNFRRLFNAGVSLDELQDSEISDEACD